MSKDNIITILSTDPGMTSLGWAHSQFNMTTGEFKVLDKGVIKAIAQAKKDKKLRDSFNAKLLASNIIYKEYKELVVDLNATYHASEDAFYNPGRPNAFLSLTMCITTLERALLDLYIEDAILLDQAVVYKFAPKLVKKSFSSDGTSDKTDMLTTLKTSNIKFNKKIIIDELVEHEIDAIAVGYTLSKLLPTFIQGSSVYETKK